MKFVGYILFKGKRSVYIAEDHIKLLRIFCALPDPQRNLIRNLGFIPNSRCFVNRQDCGKGLKTRDLRLDPYKLDLKPEELINLT